MSNDFKKCLVRDDRLNTTSEINYAVYQGGAQNTTQVYSAISKSTSSISYNIQVGSESQVLDRRVLMRNTYKLKITGSCPDGERLLNFGSNCALAAFPCNQSFSTMSASINNSTVNSQVADLLPMLLKQMTKEDLGYYGSMCPVQSDYYASYADADKTFNSPFGDYTNTSSICPNGAFVLDEVLNNTVNATGGPVDKTVYITFTTTEPLFCSPFIFGNPTSNTAGIYGLQSLSFQFQIGNVNRVFRTSRKVEVVLDSVLKSEMILNYISPHPSMLLPSRNVVPYYSLPIYKDVIGTLISAGATVKLQSPALSLNQIPDKMFVFCRKINKLPNDPDSFLPIKGISIQAFNSAGFMSSCVQQNLFHYSRECSYEGSWLDFSGRALKSADADQPHYVLTSGSVLSLEFGRHIPLESFYSAGSLCNMSLQYSVDVVNYGADIPASSYELCLVVMNSGIMAIEKGTSSIFSGILSKADVLDTIQQEPYSQSDVARMVGGGWFDSLKSIAGKVGPKLLPVARGLLEKSENEHAKKAGALLKHVGYGNVGAGKLASRT